MESADQSISGRWVFLYWCLDAVLLQELECEGCHIVLDSLDVAFVPDISYA